MVWLVGCQVAPTKVQEKQNRPFPALVAKSLKPVELSDNTVIVDARSSFDYGLNHVVNSIYLPWSDLAESEKTGELLRKDSEAVKRLALKGVTPDVPIVVVGYGPSGSGEEGRVAWSLLYYGFKDVQVTAIESLRSALTINPSPARENAKVWKVNPRSELVIKEKDFKTWALDAKKRVQEKVHILDVRSAREYFNKSTITKGMKAQPNIDAINIEWKEFYTSDGRPDVALKAKLQGLGIGPNDRIILLSNKGVRSASASYALLALGFEHVQNYVGGWLQLMQ